MNVDDRMGSCRDKGRMWGRVGALCLSWWLRGANRSHPNEDKHKAPSSTPPRPLCMTFRHRHFSLSRLIETAEVEPGKAETGEKKAGCEEHACAIRRKGCPRSRLLLIPLYLSEGGRQQLSRTLLECRASA